MTLVTIKKWRAEWSRKTCLQKSLHDSTLLEQVPARVLSAEAGDRATHVRLVRALDLVARAVLAAPNEGFEACHSETVIPLHNNAVIS